MAQKKHRIGLVFGGRSGEHEVSLASATSVMANLDSDKYEVVPIGITKQGSWLLGTEPARLLETEQSVSASTSTEETTAVTLTGDPSLRRLIPLQSSEQLEDNGALDVILPVLHGTYGEDGALQGPLGMDEEKMKMVFSSVGLPIVDYLVYRRNAWERSPETIMDAIEQHLGYPCFVKPVNLGSSVGVNKAHDRAELQRAIDEAAEFDRKIIIERNINC